MQISQEAASSTDWSLIDKIPKDRDTPLSDRYQGILLKLSQRYFLRDQGSVYLAIIERREEYDIYSNSTPAIDDVGNANQVEVAAYSTRKATYTRAPISDNEGTYLAAYTPVLHNGKVVGRSRLRQCAREETD